MTDYQFNRAVYRVLYHDGFGRMQHKHTLLFMIGFVAIMMILITITSILH